MIPLNLANEEYLDVCKNFIEIYHTKSIQENEEQRLFSLSCAIIYLLLAPYDNEKNDLMHRYKKLRDVESMPAIGEMLRIFTTMELIQFTPFSEKFESTIHKILTVSDTQLFDQLLAKSDKVSMKDMTSLEKRYERIKKRCMEHSIRVISQFYSRITMSRLTELLNVKEDESEKLISELVVNKTIYARIDRMQGEINFTQTKQAVNILNDWSKDLNELMRLLGKTNHLIKKEEMINAVLE